MGSRANYAIVGDDGFELLYSNAGAVPLLEDLAGGPAVIRRFRSEQAVDDWLDGVWCEGAALVDAANLVLLHFTWDLDGIAERARRLAEIRDTLTRPLTRLALFRSNPPRRTGATGILGP